MVTRTKRGIRRFFWAENSATFSTSRTTTATKLLPDLASGNVRDYTPFQGVRANASRRSTVSWGEGPRGDEPQEPGLFDVHRLDLRTGAMPTPKPATWPVGRDALRRRPAGPPPDGGTRSACADASSPGVAREVGPDEILDFDDFNADGRPSI
jgi:hypothetical protein